MLSLITIVQIGAHGEKQEKYNIIIYFYVIHLYVIHHSCLLVTQQTFLSRSTLKAHQLIIR